MGIAAALALGVLQGATEFLPVSSSGHLVLARALLGVHTPGAVLEAWLHLGTLAAVLAVFGGQVRTLAGAASADRARSRPARRALLALAVGSVPAAALGLAARTGLEAAFASPRSAAFGLLATTCVLVSMRFSPLGLPAGTAGDPPQPGAWRALAVGAAQALALLPGLSRSGATIAAGRWLGLCGSDAAAFSFLLSVPAVVGAAALELAGHAGPVVSASAVFGAAAAFAVGYGALRAVLALVKGDRLYLFAPYTLALALVVLVRT